MEAPIFPSRGEIAVAKPELGIKRVCGGCGSKFYDLARDPITCPKCGAAYEAVMPTTRPTARPEAVPPPIKPVEAPEPVPSAEAEVISLEEADAETAGTKKAAVADADVETEEEVEIASGSEDDTFLEEEEEESGNVSEIIGEKVEDDDET